MATSCPQEIGKTIKFPVDIGLQTQREEARADLNPGKFGKGPAVVLNMS